MQRGLIRCSLADPAALPNGGGVFTRKRGDTSCPHKVPARCGAITTEALVAAPAAPAYLLEFPAQACPVSAGDRSSLRPEQPSMHTDSISLLDRATTPSTRLLDLRQVTALSAENCWRGSGRGHTRVSAPHSTRNTSKA